MVGSEFIDHISKLKVTTYVGVEDFADKFNFLLTVIMLLLCTAIVTVKQYILKPITCYISTEVGGANLLNYVENYCWVQGTLPVSYEGKMPSTADEWTRMEDQKILYYQWVPFLLGLQCIMFYIPRLIWQTICYNQTGTDLENLINKSVSASQTKQNDKPAAVAEVASTVEHLLFQQQRRACLKSNPMDKMQVERSGLLGGSSEQKPRRKMNLNGDRLSALTQRRGNYIVTTYIVVKLLYLINAVGQIFLMQYFLGFHGNKSAFGLQVLDNMIRGHDWEETLVFPRVGFCYVQMKIIGVQTNGVTAQCALPVNMLNEKIYVFLWWWILCAAFVTAISLLLWVCRICCRSRETSYITKYINLAENIVPFDERDAYDFASEFLRRDGMFLIRMIRMNSGDILAAEVVNCLWDRYLERKNEQTHDLYSNRPYPSLGWNADLAKGGKTDESGLRNRGMPRQPEFQQNAPAVDEKQNPRSIV